jgi:hypothetical protein
MQQRGFKVLPRRWVVERTFSRLGQNRQDEQGLRTSARARRLRLRGDDTLDGKEVGPCVGVFRQSLETV